MYLLVITAQKPCLSRYSCNLIILRELDNVFWENSLLQNSQIVISRTKLIWMKKEINMKKLNKIQYFPANVNSKLCYESSFFNKIICMDLLPRKSGT